MPSKIDIERDYEAYRLHVEYGFSKSEIARRLEISRPTVREALKRVTEQKAADNSPDMRRMRVQLTDQYRTTFRLAREGYDRSCEQAETETTTTTEGHTDKKGDLLDPTTTTSKTLRGQAGDPAFIAQMNNALKGIRDIHGIDEPKKIESTHTSVSVAIQSKLQHVLLHAPPELLEYLGGIGAAVDEPVTAESRVLSHEGAPDSHDGD